MVRLCLLATLVAASILPALPVAAQPSPSEVPPESSDGRFSFHRADDGYLRLDSRSGQVSMCTRRANGWQCQALPDERQALEAEIARLQNDNAALKKELLGHNLPLPEGMRPDQNGAKSSVQRPQFPDDAELNRIMSALERVWRRLVDMITNVQRDLEKRS